MRRPDPLEWLLIAAALLAVAALGQALLLSANAGLVHSLTSTVIESRAAAQPTDAPGTDGANTERGGGMSGAHTALDDVSTSMAADIAAQLARHAAWLAATNAALLIVLVAAIIGRARQIAGARSTLQRARTPPETPSA